MNRAESEKQGHGRDWQVIQRVIPGHCPDNADFLNYLGIFWYAPPENISK